MWTHIGKVAAKIRREKKHIGSASLCIVLHAAFSAILSGCAGGSASHSSSLTVSASSETVRAGDTISFSAQGESSGAGQWKVLGAVTNGTIDGSGLFHAPDAVPRPATITVSYSVGDRTATHAIQVINPTPAITGVSPNTLRMAFSNVGITGHKFVAGAQVFVNGLAVPTTFVNSASLQATIAISSSSSQLSLTVKNPEPGSSTSPPILLPAAPQSVTISPSVVTGGAVALTISGIGFSADLAATLDDRPLVLASSSDSTVAATGYLPPWHTGTSIARIYSKSTGIEVATIQLPIVPTAVSFDVASRFLTQAGFGPRPDLVQHIQAVGLSAFISEQQSMPPQPYAWSDPGVITIIEHSVLGPNPLRLRVAWALQSFLVRSGISQQGTNYPFEQKMEADSTGNFRDLLTDVASDTSIAQMLTLAGNVAPKDPAQHPNQNFARELLQLFTIGPSLLNEDGTIQTNPDGSPIPAYDEATILDLSRIFTGWNYGPSVDPHYTFYGIDWSAPLVANDSQHDKGQKTLFGNITIPAGQSTTQDRELALDAIFAHPNLPPFISRILIQRLVKDDPSPQYVKRVVGVFKDNGHGVRGDLASVVRAILLDPEARAGDGDPSPSDGFLQEPYLFQLFVMNITGWTSSDAQAAYLPCKLDECIFNPKTVFGFYSPSYRIPGTSINSPEFQLLNDVTIINRSQTLWAILTGQQGGFRRISNSVWLTQNFPKIPDLVDALNHLAYHGQMSIEEQQLIVSYCNQLQTTDPLLPIESAIFLALNADNFSVSH
ncbi:DUF1800 family protein [Edaphobacter sp. HDX4]|uniref:DUF1800 family protein n=1 Tax=Edaphobacter sp. HDX4 TaxID=2794064 RepID=UPI002FE4FF3A